MKTLLSVMLILVSIALIVTTTQAAPPAPSIGVVKDVLSCAEVQGSPTIIRFIDQVRTADGNRLTVVCYSRMTADGEGAMDCVAGR
jgi:hypothetical protein